MRPEEEGAYQRGQLLVWKSYARGPFGLLVNLAPSTATDIDLRTRLQTLLESSKRIINADPEVDTPFGHGTVQSTR